MRCCAVDPQVLACAGSRRVGRRHTVLALWRAGERDIVVQMENHGEWLEGG
ncbi:hypothetical protein BH24CHL6_BH24CHL6_15060 [soil metagenome]